MKHITFILCAFIAQFSFSQVPKKVVVEHFTNSKCSFCATRNPGFYDNLNNQSGVIHLAIHPSSPYSGCLINQHNVSENDGRTNYYGIYGSTPRLVIQGAPIPGGANYSSSSIFTPHLGQTSPASLTISQTKFGADSIISTIVIKTEEAHSLGELKLFVALAEDTLFYTGSNGEPQHYDVFRKSFTGTSGISVTLPATVGESVSFSYSSAANAAWVFERIFTLAILQEAGSKAVVQAEAVPASQNDPNILGINTSNENESHIDVFQTEEGVLIHQYAFSEPNSITIYDVTGKVVLSQKLNSNLETVILPSNTKGFYLYEIGTNSTTQKTGKLILN